MNTKIKRIIFLFLIFISFLFVNYGFAASGNGFSKFDNAPRYFLHIDNGNLIINITDFSGIKEENIELFLNNSKGSKLTKGNGIKSIKCLEEREKKEGKRQVKYEYKIEKKFLKNNYKKSTNDVKFYLRVKDNYGNYIHSYFRIYKKSDEFNVDPAPRINSFKAKGNDVTFNTRDLAGTYELKIFDLNNGTKQVGKTYKKLAKGNAQIKIDLNDFTKGKDGKYRIKFYSKDKNKTNNNDNQMAVTRTIAFSVEEVALKDIEIKEKINLYVGDTKELEIIKKPKNATVKKSSYVSSDEKIVTVDKNGKIKAMAEGKANIIVTVDGIKKECEVIVSKLEEANLDKEFIAYGMNGGVRVGFKKMNKATSYKLKVKDYSGKTYNVTVPRNNTTNTHEYDTYRTSSDNMIYYNVKKLNDDYNYINTWMNKNNQVYSFKVIGYDSSGKKVNESKWLKVMPFNVEIEAPDQEVPLPAITVVRDPNDPNRSTQNGTRYASNKNKIMDKHRFEISKIKEENGKVYFEWKNTVKGFTPESYIIKYKKYYQDKESKNSSIKSKIIEIKNENKYTIKGLKNEQEYLIQVIAKGKVGGQDIYMLAEEVVIPHTKSSRKALLSKVNNYRGNPYNGSYDLYHYLSRNEAEAYANYGNNGGAFKSSTEYFVWVNMYELRVYIFSKNKTNYWRLFKDVPCGFGSFSNPTSPRIAVANHREWIWNWADHGSNNTYTPSYYGVYPNTVEYLVGIDPDYMGNVFHSQTLNSMGPRIIRYRGGSFCTAGCIQLDRPWEKWMYEYSIGSTVYVDGG